jgi:hypothetical protein
LKKQTNNEAEIDWISHGTGKRGISRKNIQSAVGVDETKGA